ncbi:alpha-D-ribose 1-methylphosphonate 5-triphosphate diphosphatase [Aestuariivirga sp.]|uniref:alpha-D-ribose 1-methylphosphonate 5-triphosphate diphosphatase n=1 Tax=Aestuariivirga sp. TaxID=2650926 RepID=UPI0025BFE4FC|nr:alpha-D-ribose 1-methylphosphonate 5-triphosphate diphosphatase [Aestuariivirga sp.]MCA3555344.1 alpha-D-ribose 1-methylphosphonate 5-triphosphate diphosphatase [Aestuariivirga sp.]
MTAAELIVSGGLCLLPGRGLAAADIVCSGGSIAEIRAPGGGAGGIDAAGCLVLPGIVDIHGDAFERQIMPRPKTMFPLDMAMRETDRQLAANGITTAYHGITISWEPGLRSLEQSLRVVAALDRLEPLLAADNRIHIRWETFALDQAAEVLKLLARARAPLLAFNDHTSPLMKAADARSAVNRHAERAMVAPERYLALYEQAIARGDGVPAAIHALAEAARRQGVAMLSHDDRTAEDRAFYRALGAHIAEFPVTAEALDACVDGEDVVVLGAPNVVRGGSHCGAIGAEQAVRAGTCAILASDYFYPAPLHAALDLVERGALPMERAWALISANPARAAGLADRGGIAEGLRADLLVLSPLDRQPVATVCAGRAVYRSR